MTEDVKAREGSNPLWHMSAREQLIKVAGFVQKLHKNAKLVQIVQLVEHKSSLGVQRVDDSQQRSKRTIGDPRLSLQASASKCKRGQISTKPINNEKKTIRLKNQ